MLPSTARQISQGSLYLFNSLLTASPDMVFRLGMDGTILDFYPASNMDSSISAKDLIGNRIQNLFPHEKTNQIKTLIHQAQETGKLQVCKAQIRINSHTNHIEARYIPCSESEVIVIVCDVTDNQRIESALRESVARFRDAFDFAAIGRAIAIPQGEFIRVNNSFCQLLGYAREELLTKTWLEITHPDDLKASLEYAQDLFNGKIPSFRHIHRLIHKCSKPVWVDLTVVLLKDANGNPLYVVGDIVDITEQMLAEQALQASEETYREFVEGTDDLITRFDPQATITFVNHRSNKIIGLPPDKCIGLSVYDFVHPEDKQAFQKAFASWVANRVTNTTYENRQISRSGQVFHLLWTINLHYGPLGELDCINGIARDITERKVSEKVLKYLATHDPLTSLPNRTLFSDRLNHALLLASRSSTNVAVMFIDLDGFKSVNDAFGHEMGDQVLRRVAKRLNSCVRESDTIARLSGDEFTLVVENITNPEDAAVIAQKILTTLSAPLQEEGQLITITASIGISIYPINGKDERSLLKTADAAMYKVKNSTKNGYRFFG